VLQFEQILGIMKDITTQISSNLDVYQKCNVQFEVDQQKETIKLSVDMFFEGYRTIQIDIDRRTGQNGIVAWYINNEIQKDDPGRLYSTLLNKFKSLHVDVYNTLRYQRIADGSHEWIIKFDQETSRINASKKSDNSPMFNIDFELCGKLNGPIIGMLTVHGALRYKKFDGYDDLVALLKKKGFKHGNSEPLQPLESEQMWSAINQLSTILEQTRFTEPSH